MAHISSAPQFTSISGVPIEPLYGPEQLANFDPARDLGDPGEFPYTRGIHRDMYRGKLWTIRQFSGFATPEETNRRYHYLLEHGQAGLSVAFDLPTLMGYDPDHPMSEGEVGKCGASICSLEDMEILFRGIPLGEVTVSMTINSPAAVLWAMYLAVAEKQAVDWQRLSGTLQNDILKEYIAQKEYIFPPRPSMRLVTDTIEFGARHTPRFNPISISGYHIREAGSTAAQELAFTLRDGIEYVDWALDRGMQIDEFAPRLSFFFNAHSDFFEEIAKYRAARKIWAHVMRERYAARNERSMKLRFHAQTAGCSLTWQQPYNNVVRTAWQAMSAVLGGAQSLHTNSLDEAYALPSEEAVTIALRTQQILAHETGVANTPDPLGGSYFIEKLTLDMEESANDYIRRIDQLGGMIPAIEAGFPQSEIASASYRYQREVEQGERVIVGANRFHSQEQQIEILQIDETAQRSQEEKLKRLRARRDRGAVQKSLDNLKRSAESTENTMPCIIDAVRAYATLGEICDALRHVFGAYTETTHL
ncbi:MAG: methylmalonyl-CoA mutase family protein [Acidobacteriaceae bacterium]|nr:methylmalonyl-CoA mutase family protein [Acidobacteriaceae bacterium]MBV9779856.1 methylmalonyl-CoA mutase family protein [Acidobacteriaceae bacterium]